VLTTDDLTVAAQISGKTAVMHKRGRVEYGAAMQLFIDPELEFTGPDAAPGRRQRWLQDSVAPGRREPRS
jgi:hypothetical protein